MTTRPCETRAGSPRGGRRGTCAMWASWISAKSVGPASSALTTLLVRKFMPCSPAHCAERRLAPPYQIRAARPGECGSTRSENTSMPSVPLNVGDRLAAHEAQQPLDPSVGEVLDVGGVRVERVLDVVPVHRRPDADAGVEPAAGQHVDGGQVLGEPQRVLPAERGHGGAELDA